MAATNNNEGRTLFKIAQDLGTLLEQSRTASLRQEELKKDFDEKHRENIKRSEQDENRLDDVEKRVLSLEQSHRQVIGDGLGENGLLHRIDKTQREQGEKLQKVGNEISQMRESIDAMRKEQKPVHAYVGKIGTAIALLTGAAVFAFSVLGAFHYWQSIIGHK
jgi:hypothetical protein